MIAPYSPRGREGAIIAAPLYWDEVNKQLQRKNFSLDNIRKYRLTDRCPMATFFETKNDTIAKNYRFIKRIKLYASICDFLCFRK
ncbi:hypothetical protein CKF48_19920 [Cytobacillus kochii]|uniref:DNA ligase D polymerase domain-containing protein n=1 Tax=Cytobacillus kochii TaxID=859143 RepID=A0A248TMP3_9BACI|nr:hypothetical protein CKF48_19920 [Cytobacillus kochii]